MRTRDLVTGLSGLVLVLVMAGPNLATGMMPLYRQRWQLSPLTITAIFATYLFALVPTLLTIGRVRDRRGWRPRIAWGVAAAVVADLIMAGVSTASFACAARVATGLSVGLVTGSLAGLALECSGEAARTAMATATVLGSAIGTLAAAVFAQYLPAPAVSVYLVHAVLLAAVAGILLLRWPAEARNSARTEPAPTAVVPASARTGYLCGTAAWVCAGLVVALLPSYGAALLTTHNLVALALPVTAYLLAAWLVQRVVPVTSRGAGPRPGLVLMVVGVAVAASAPILGNLVVLLVGGVIAGIGQGLAYRTGLRIVSASTPPGEHARAAGRYAAVAYLAAAAATVGLGAVGTELGMTWAVVVAAAALTAIGGIVAVDRTRASDTRTSRSTVHSPV